MSESREEAESESESAGASATALPLPLSWSGTGGVRSAAFLVGVKRETETRLTEDRSGGFDGLILPLVEVGNEKVENGRILFGEVDRLRVRLAEFAAESSLEVVGFEEDVFVHLWSGSA